MPYCRRGEEAAISMAKLLDTFGYARAQPRCNHSNHRTQRNGPQGCCCLRRVPSGTDTAYSLVLRIRQYRRIQLPRGSDHPCARPRPGVQRHRVAPAERRAAIAERPIAANHFRRYSARAPTLPHMHRDWAHPCHICRGTGLTPATYAPGLGSPPTAPATSAPGWAYLLALRRMVVLMKVGGRGQQLIPPMADALTVDGRARSHAPQVNQLSLAARPINSCAH